MVYVLLKPLHLLHHKIARPLIVGITYLLCQVYLVLCQLVFYKRLSILNSEFLFFQVMLVLAVFPPWVVVFLRQILNM